jgi:hypothetical protein
LTMIDPITLVTVVGTWALVVGTLAFAYSQLRQAQRLHSATTLLDLRERFYSPRMRQARQALSSWLLKSDRGEEIDNWEVAIFFELMGFLTRTHVLEKRIVNSAFGTWICAYYLFITQPVNLLEKWRTESDDPLVFADFEWLAQAMLDFDRRLGPSSNRRSTSVEDARYVLEGDARLDLSGGLAE